MIINLIKNIWSILQGKKTYIVAAFAVLYALASVFIFHTMTWSVAFNWLLTSGYAISIRSALKKLETN